MIKDKRGLERRIIVSIFLVLLGFFILLFVIGRFGEIIPETFDKETCRISAITRAGLLAKPTVSVIFGIPSLKCKTEYTCLNMGGKCPDGFNVEKVKDEEAIKRKLADSMADCWYQLGQGQIDFIGQKTFQERACVICTRISFDSEIKAKTKTINDFQNYLSSTKIGVQDTTYLQYLSNNPNVEIIGTQKPIDTSKEYAVVYSMLTKEFLTDILIGGTVGFYGGAQLGAVVGTIAGPPGAGVGFVIGGSVGAIAGTLGIDWLQEKIGAEKVLHSIQLIEYDAKEIGKACTLIESLP